MRQCIPPQSQLSTDCVGDVLIIQASYSYVIRQELGTLISLLNETNFEYKRQYELYYQCEKEAASKGELFVNPMATYYSVQKEKEKKVDHINKTEFNLRKEFLHKIKQGPNRDKVFSLAACTTKNIIKQVENVLPKDKNILKFYNDHENLIIGFHCDSATYKGVARNIDSFAFLNVDRTKQLHVHPFNIFKGADSKENFQVTLHEQKLFLRKLNGTWNGH